MNNELVIGEASIIPTIPFGLEDIYDGKFKPLTKKENEKFLSLQARDIFNKTGFKTIKYGKTPQVIFVHKYNQGTIVPKWEINKVWRNGNIDPKYILTYKGFVLASENYSFDISLIRPNADLSVNSLCDTDTYKFADFPQGTSSVTFDVAHVDEDKIK
jgi:hypothetical protein